MDYVRFNRELLECLVEDPSTDIFQIPTLNGYAYEEALVSLLDNVCSDDYDFKITEIKPMINGDNDIIPRFLEGYNYGRDIKVNDLRAIFGPSNMLNDVIIPQGEFFTFYDGYPPYQDYQCKGICMNVSLIKGPNSAIEWEATIESGQDPDNPNNALIIDRIAPFSILYWQTISNGYSYQLRNIGYNNQYGANWRQSCSISANMNNKPDDECIYFPNQCHNDTQCQLSGDINGKCNTINTAYCDCSSYGYFSDGPTCAPS